MLKSFTFVRFWADFGGLQAEVFDFLCSREDSAGPEAEIIFSLKVLEGLWEVLKIKFLIFGRFPMDVRGLGAFKKELEVLRLKSLMRLRVSKEIGGLEADIFELVFSAGRIFDGLRSASYDCIGFGRV